MPTLEDLGKAVKSKYPGHYDDLGDADLALMVKSKHPGAYDDYSMPAVPNPASPSSSQNPITTGNEAARQDIESRYGNQAMIKSAVNALPYAGASIPNPTGPFGGAAMGSIVKQALQGRYPQQLGESPSDLTGNLMDTGKDVLGAAGIPALISKIPGIGAYLASKVKSDNPTVNEYINNKLTGMYPNTPENLGDPASIPKIPTGVTQEQLALKQVISAGYKNPSSVDLEAIEKELAGKNTDFYDKAISPETQDNLTSFLKKAKELEPDEKTGGVDSMLRYAKHRLAFDVAAGAIGGHEAGLVGTGAALGTVYLSRAAFSKLMSSPMMGKLAIQALETPGASEQAGVISKALLYGMRGVDLDFVDSKGNKEKAQVSNDGQLQLKSPSTQ